MAKELYDPYLNKVFVRAERTNNPYAVAQIQIALKLILASALPGVRSIDILGRQSRLGVTIIVLFVTFIGWISWIPRYAPRPTIVVSQPRPMQERNLNPRRVLLGGAPSDS